MAIEHANIADAYRHEPKGASTASSGTVYVSDGSGSGSWTYAKLTGQSAAEEGDIAVSTGSGGVEWQSREEYFGESTFVEVLDAYSSDLTQYPSTTDTALQINFGSAQNSSSDAVMLDSAGTITINEAGNYTIKTYIQYGRESGSGSAVYFFRALLNGEQTGPAVQAVITAADVTVPFSDTTTATLSAGDTLEYQVIRDSSGADEGGLLATTVTAGWTSATTASINIRRVE